VIQVLNPTQQGAFSPNGNLAYSLLHSVGSQPERTAIVHGQERTTYGELLRRTESVAAQLRSIGIQKGDKVGLLFPNHPDFIACFFAVVGIGAIVVPINPLLKSEEIEHILKDSGAKALLVHANTISEALTALPTVPSVKSILVSGAVPAELNDSALPCDILSCAFDSLPSTRIAFCDVDPDKDLALIVYTSGTTGKPKGAMLSHTNIRSVMPDPLLGHCNIGNQDRWLAMLPLCHIYGLGVIVYTTITTGGTITILEKFDPVQALETIQQEQITLLPAVPSMYQFMLLEMERKTYDVSSVRVCFSGAAALTPEVLEKTEQAFGAPVIEGYALSETACGATINRYNARRTGSIGTPLMGIQVCILNENGDPLVSGIDNVGEIAIKGRNVMLGYHNQPQATEEVMRNGWFLTGDLGYFDEDGFFYIVGRKKEMIIRGGQNIYPREIEDVIARIPGVAEVAVIGVPDNFMGERVKAIVVPRAGSALTEDQVKEFCTSHLAQYKVPRLVEFISTPLPRNSTGKVLKRLLS
jgi:long-chain acyl-CoA synthetase